MTDTPKVAPALTPDEWEAFQAAEFGRRLSPFVEAASEIPDSAKHGSAALALYRQPFGFTHEDVKTLRWAESLLRSGDCGTFYKEADAVESVADRVEALLPPQ